MTQWGEMKRARRDDWELVIFFVFSFVYFQCCCFYVNFNAIKTGSLFDLSALPPNQDPAPRNSNLPYEAACSEARYTN